MEPDEATDEKELLHDHDESIEYLDGIEVFDTHLRTPNHQSVWTRKQQVLFCTLLVLLVCCIAVGSSLLTKMWLQRRSESVSIDLVGEPYSIYYDYGTVPGAVMRAMDALVRTQKPRSLRYACRKFCGGLADRIRGVQTLAYMAALTDRQFVIDPSILTRRPPQDISESVAYMRHVDNCTDLISAIVGATDTHVEVETNCLVEQQSWSSNQSAAVLEGLPRPEEFPHTRISWEQIEAVAKQRKEKGVDMTTLDVLAGQCITYHDCGVLALIVSGVAHEPLTAANRLAESAIAALGNPYTGLHVRCGGSLIPVASTCEVGAVSYYDGLKGDLPRLLLEYFQDLRDRGFVYPGSVALASDSARFKGEVFAVMAGSAPGLLGCCFPPRHIDRDKALATPPLQEFIDLILLSRSVRILSTSGAYSALASVFTHFSTAATPVRRLCTDSAGPRLSNDSLAVLAAALA